MPTKIRYRQEDDSRGVMVLESSPQVRTLLSLTEYYEDAHRFRISGRTYQDYPAIQLAFPYLIHILGYGIKNGKYTYHGVYDKGLCVFLATESLSSLESLLCYSPTDLERHGLVCTDHSYDRKSFGSAKQLAGTVLSVWWGMYHQIPYDTLKAWKKLNPQNAVKYPWKNAMSLRAALEWDAVRDQHFGSYSQGIGLLDLPGGSSLINEDLFDVPTIGDLE